MKIIIFYYNYNIFFYSYIYMRSNLFFLHKSQYVVLHPCSLSSIQQKIFYRFFKFSFWIYILLNKKAHIYTYILLAFLHICNLRIFIGKEILKVIFFRASVLKLCCRVIPSLLIRFHLSKIPWLNKKKRDHNLDLMN